MKICIVEDNPGRMLLFRKYLCIYEVIIEHVSTASAAIGLLRSTAFDAVFLDHDLDESGKGCGTGAEVVTAIRDLYINDCYPSVFAPHYIHSMNPVGADTMFTGLRNCGVNVTRWPELWSDVRGMHEVAYGLPHSRRPDPLTTLFWDDVK